MSDRKIAMVEPKKSFAAMIMAAAMAVYREMKGTKPRMKGWNDDGSIRYRSGTHRGFGMFGRVRGLGGTASYNALPIVEHPRRPKKVWPFKRKVAA